MGGSNFKPVVGSPAHTKILSRKMCNSQDASSSVCHFCISEPGRILDVDVAHNVIGRRVAILSHHNWNPLQNRSSQLIK